MPALAGSSVDSKEKGNMEEWWTTQLLDWTAFDWLRNSVLCRINRKNSDKIRRQKRHLGKENPDKIDQ